MRGAPETAGSSTTRINRGEGAWLAEVIPSFRRFWAQEIVSFGCGSQSRETMEVEDCYSAKSECYGAFERRRETSTMKEKKRAFTANIMKRVGEIGEMYEKLDQKERKMMHMIRLMKLMIKGGIEKKEKAALIICMAFRTRREHERSKQFWEWAGVFDLFQGRD